MIDFEYSGYNPRAFDIANHFCEVIHGCLDVRLPYQGSSLAGIRVLNAVLYIIARFCLPYGRLQTVLRSVMVHNKMADCCSLVTIDPPTNPVVHA